MECRIASANVKPVLANHHRGSNHQTSVCFYLHLVSSSPPRCVRKQVVRRVSPPDFPVTAAPGQAAESANFNAPNWQARACRFPTSSQHRRINTPGCASAPRAYRGPYGPTTSTRWADKGRESEKRKRQGASGRTRTRPRPRLPFGWRTLCRDLHQRRPPATSASSACGKVGVADAGLRWPCTRQLGALCLALLASRSGHVRLSALNDDKVSWMMMMHKRASKADCY